MAIKFNYSKCGLPARARIFIAAKVCQIDETSVSVGEQERLYKFVRKLIWYKLIGKNLLANMN